MLTLVYDAGKAVAVTPACGPIRRIGIDELIAHERIVYEEFLSGLTKK